LAPQVGLEPTTLRLTADGSKLEYVCFQRRTEKRRGNIGAFSARKWAKFLTTFHNQPGSHYLIVEEFVAHSLYL
jgi:hypothetical protein